MVECSECKKFYDCLYGGELVGRLTSCPDFQQKPKTNADRIRAMSDEELVKFIGHNSLCDQIQNNEGKWCESQGVCNNCLVEWLKQPADDLPKITDQTKNALEKMGDKAHGGE